MEHKGYKSIMTPGFPLSIYQLFLGNSSQSMKERCWCKWRKCWRDKCGGVIHEAQTFWICRDSHLKCPFQYLMGCCLCRLFLKIIANSDWIITGSFMVWCFISIVTKYCAGNRLSYWSTALHYKWCGLVLLFIAPWESILWFPIETWQKLNTASSFSTEWKHFSLLLEQWFSIGSDFATPCFLCQGTYLETFLIATLG